MRKLILSLMIVFSLVNFVFAQDYQCSGYGMGGMMSGAYGYGGMWLFGWLFGILILVALVLLIIWLIKQIQKKK